MNDELPQFTGVHAAWVLAWLWALHIFFGLGAISAAIAAFVCTLYGYPEAALWLMLVIVVCGFVLYFLRRIMDSKPV